MDADPVYRLLGLCARAQCNQKLLDQIQAAARTLPDWSAVPQRAEDHRVTPLLYTHLKAARVEAPPAVWRELQGLYLRHRRANEIRTAALREIMVALDSATIPVVVLKGAALSHFLYPEPALRPHSDLDLLVSPANLLRAQQVVLSLGFQGPSASAITHRHLPPLHRLQDGLSVEVELHQRLLSNYFDNVRAYARGLIGRRDSIGVGENRLPDVSVPLYAFQIDDQPAFTLGLEDQLRHLCDHLISHVNVWDNARLIWMADLISLSERFAHDIDWAHVPPRVINTLALLHWQTPLSEELRRTAGIKIGARPDGIGVEFDGWPRVRSSLRQALWPAEWWLRLRYARGAKSLWRERWLRHPLHMVGQVLRALLEKLGLPTGRELAIPSQEHH
jgi:hypothetical protein